MDKFEEEVAKLDEHDPCLIEKWEELIERFCKPALHHDDETQVKHMKQCVALIGYL